jgi:hypothetical protein
MNKTLFFLIVVLSTLLAACSPALTQSAPDYYGYGGDVRAEEEALFAPAAEPAFDEGAEFERGAAGDTSVANQADGGERIVIKNANMSIAVEDPVAAMETLLKMAEDMGGFVVYSELYYRTLESGAEVPQANVSFRVPAERLDEALAGVEAGAGQILSKNVSGQDVTQDYTDLTSRLFNLEAAESELQEILESAEDTEAVLDVFNTLVSIREQIEVTKGRIQYYEQSAAFSSVTVEIVADAAVQPLTIGGWQPSGVAKEAVQALLNTLTTLADIGIWGVLYLLPVLLVILIPLWLILRGLRRLFRRNRPAKAAAEDQA